VSKNSESNIQQFLSNLPLFSEFDQADLEQIARQTRWLAWKNGRQHLGARGQKMCVELPGGSMFGDDFSDVRCVHADTGLVLIQQWQPIT